MNCRDMVPLIHAHLDRTLDQAEQGLLQQHLIECQACNTLLDRYEQTEAFIQYMPEPVVSEDLTERIMKALPKQERSVRFKGWVKRHPAVSVAVVFMMVMMSSFLSLWDTEQNLVLKGADLDDIVIEGNTVIIPAGRTVDGDLFVENGQLQVDGVVQGNLTIVDGSVHMASTASIAGQVTSVNQTIDYFWFKVKEFFSGFNR
jgi:anti-sigma factor RsiW